MVYAIDDIIFDVGDMIIDSADKEAGILLEKYKILPERTYESGFTTDPVWAWRILWAGPDMTILNRLAAYTETGLKNMVFCGRMILIKSNHDN